MSDPIIEEGAPIVITDKREQRRQEAEARRLAAEEAAKNVVTPEEVAATALDEADDAVALDDPSALTVNRAERIAELIEQARSLPEGAVLPEDERAELLRLQAEEDDAQKLAAADAPLSVRTAFLVLVGHDGTATATSDCNQSIEIDHEATIDDMYAGSAIVMRDIDASIAAKHVVFGLNVSAQAMQEKQMAVRAMQNLQAPPGARRRR